MAAAKVIIDREAVAVVVRETVPEVYKEVKFAAAAHILGADVRGISAE